MFQKNDFASAVSTLFPNSTEKPVQYFSCNYIGRQVFIIYYLGNKVFLAYTIRDHGLFITKLINIMKVVIM